MIFFAFSHFLDIIFIINNFCIIQTLRQVYSHIKGERLTILSMFFNSYYHYINLFKLKKDTTLDPMTANIIQADIPLFCKNLLTDPKLQMLGAVV